jgi:predicted nicotinamide N-methyase
MSVHPTFADWGDPARTFVLEHTGLAPVPMVPGVHLHTATELVPIWHATEAWLTERGVAIPFWCVPWPGGQALARFVLDHPEIVRGRSVLDFGTGSGLLAIVAAMAGATAVRAVDIDPLAAAAASLNAVANGVTVEVACEEVEGRAVEADVVLAGDVWYERAPAERFVAWFEALAAAGTRVLTGDPGRAYAPRAPCRVRELARYDVPTVVELESSATRLTRVLEILPPRVRESSG